MDGPVTAHELVNPGALAPAVGFSHAVVAAPGRTIWLGGQTAHDAEGRVVGDTVAEQYDRAAANVVTALAACGAGPEHLVSLTITTTDIQAWRASQGELGAAHRRHFGRHYPAAALLGVAALADPDASVELLCVAVVPE